MPELLRKNQNYIYIFAITVHIENNVLSFFPPILPYVYILGKKNEPCPLLSFLSNIFVNIFGICGLHNLLALQQLYRIICLTLQLLRVNGIYKILILRPDPID